MKNSIKCIFALLAVTSLNGCVVAPVPYHQRTYYPEPRAFIQIHPRHNPYYYFDPYGLALVITGIIGTIGGNYRAL
jgi:hypothetical protein